MKKQFISLLTALSMTAAIGTSVSAADKANAEPDVYVNGSRIMFDDQNAKIVDGVTLVPARGVFECMGHKVSWDEDTRTVTVEGSTGVRVITLVIDSNVMTINTFKTIFEKNTEEYTLEVPAQIMNDRTMIPLRAVSEAFNCEVEWDQENYRIDITPGAPILLEDAQPTPAPAEDEILKMSLSTDATDIKAGDEFTVYIEATNVPENSFLSCISFVMSYDKDKFEYISGTLLDDNGEEIPPATSAENTEYYCGTKGIFVTIDQDAANKEDGKIFKCTFKALTDEGGTIAFNNDYDLVRGFESYLMYTNIIDVNDPDADYIDKIYDADEIIVDKTPLKIGE